MKLRREHIKAFIGEPYFSRGVEYFKDGQIKLTAISETLVKAKASGTRVYKVEATFENSRVGGQCSCPAFEEFGPCKHLAATLLTWIAYDNGSTYRSSQQSMDQIAEHEEFERMLKRKTKNELIEIIVSLSDDYPEIIDELSSEYEEYE